MLSTSKNNSSLLREYCSVNVNEGRSLFLELCGFPSQSCNGVMVRDGMFIKDFKITGLIEQCFFDF